MTAALPAQIRSVPELRAAVQKWRAQGERIALVPTMGALHAGHLSLVKLARRHADRVIASIFVNPTQFGPNEDFSRYPRMEAADSEKLATAHTDAVFLPSVADMYPQGFATRIHVDGVTDGLCGTFRPGHFDGVATVVAKLLLMVLPDCAIFGEKDFQQLHVIRRMVADLNIPVEILGAPILREHDGLAMSSRNAYLSADERRIAAALPQTLAAAADAMQNGAPMAQACAQARKLLLGAGFESVDYIEVRRAADLSAFEDEALPAGTPARLLAAVRLGKTRLIDNFALQK